MKIIKAEVTGEKLKKDFLPSFTKEVLEQLYFISHKQDLSHIVALFLKEQNVPMEERISKKFSESIYLALKRYENFEYEQNRIYELFEKERICYIPLKGAVIRKYYHKPWLRTSGDIDILIKKEDLERAQQILTKELQYSIAFYNYHDASMYSKTGVHLELHFNLLENVENIDQLLEKVWEHVYPIKQGSYRYAMEKEYFMFYILAHMYYHFLHGGCGVRTVIDMWLLFKQQYNGEVLNEYCKMCGIDTFAEYILKLTKVWFEGGAHCETTYRLQQYVIKGGVYGSKESAITAKRTKQNGRGIYVLKRIFMSYKELCVLYPELKRYPIFYPYYCIKRLRKVFKPTVFYKSLNEAKINYSINKSEVDQLQELFKSLKI